MKKRQKTNIKFLGGFFIILFFIFIAREGFAQISNVKLKLDKFILAKQFIIPNKDFTKGASTIISVRRTDKSRTCDNVCIDYYQDSCVYAYRRMTVKENGRPNSLEIRNDGSIDCNATDGIPASERSIFSVTSFSADCSCAKLSTQQPSQLSSKAIIDGRVEARDFIVEPRTQGKAAMLSTLITRNTGKTQTCDALCSNINRFCVEAIDVALGYSSKCDLTSSALENELYCLCGNNNPY